MKKKLPLVFLFLLITSIVFWFGYILSKASLPLLHPYGQIALEERDLIVTSMTIMLSIAIPVVLLVYFVAWKYRSGNTRSHYAPDWTGNSKIKLAYWAFLGSLVVVFSIIAWNGAHRLDPYKPIESTTKPITIQVVALQWKWLFIYPEQHIATVNFIQFPSRTPLDFRLTADAPMNSFWIPALGGQIYSMSKMETKTHLIANTTGDFPGGAAEINGAGFSGMRFTARASTLSDFDTWVEGVRNSSKPLTRSEYEALAKPSEDNPVVYYSSVDDDLYKTIIMKYMAPTQDESQEMHM